ncbi:MAG TPA: hypothetical protein DIT01_08530 [Lentisphaeria bacterium]|nr:hypothetical protein [Lentisphaeria bacterium]
MASPEGNELFGDETLATNNLGKKPRRLFEQQINAVVSGIGQEVEQFLPLRPAGIAIAGKNQADVGLSAVFAVSAAAVVAIDTPGNDYCTVGGDLLGIGPQLFVQLLWAHADMALQWQRGQVGDVGNAHFGEMLELQRTQQFKSILGSGE